MQFYAFSVDFFIWTYSIFYLKLLASSIYAKRFFFSADGGYILR